MAGTDTGLLRAQRNTDQCGKEVDQTRLYGIFRIGIQECTNKTGSGHARWPTRDLTVWNHSIEAPLGGLMNKVRRRHRR